MTFWRSITMETGKKSGDARAWIRERDEWVEHRRFLGQRNYSV